MQLTVASMTRSLAARSLFVDAVRSTASLFAAVGISGLLTPQLYGAPCRCSVPMVLFHCSYYGIWIRALQALAGGAPLDARGGNNDDSIDLGGLAREDPSRADQGAHAVQVPFCLGWSRGGGTGQAPGRNGWNGPVATGRR